jgi:hypothetical protein
MPKKLAAGAPRVARDHNHEIDTEARRLLPLQFPAAWVLRDVVQDYGIDLEVEPFEGGHSLGDLLLLQIKGYDGAIAAGNDHTFVMRTNGLKYAQRFIVPALLVVQPLQGDKQARYLWLQEYTRLVLDHDKPNWRSQGRVTLVIPATNVLANRLDHLRGLAAIPRRTEELGQLVRIAHELEFVSGSFQFAAGAADSQRLVSLIDEALALRTVFGEAGMPFTRNVLREQLVIARALLLKLEQGAEVEPADLPGIIISALPEPGEARRWHLEAAAQMRVAAAGRQLSATIATAMDHRLRRTIWKATGEHAF